MVITLSLNRAAIVSLMFGKVQDLVLVVPTGSEKQFWPSSQLQSWRQSITRMQEVKEEPSAKK